MNASTRAALALTLSLFVACSKQSTTETDDAPPASEEVTAEPAPSESIAMATPAPAATPEPNYFAPEGVFFLVGSKSIETADGLERIMPGTRLERQPDGAFKDGQGHLLTLAPHEVTNDLRIAQRAAGVDAARQAAIRQQLATPAAKPIAGKPAGAGAARPAAPAAPQVANPAPAPALAARETGNGSMQSRSSLGSSHTRVKNGIVWEKNSQGEWIGIRYTRGGVIPRELAPVER